MGDKVPQSTTNCVQSTTKTEQILTPVSVPPREAFRLLGIGEKWGYQLIKQNVIPTVRIGKRRLLVPVDELKKMLVDRSMAERSCRTCSKKQLLKDGKWKCEIFTAPPKNIENCSAWSYDQDWRAKVSTAMSGYLAKE